MQAGRLNLSQHPTYIFAAGYVSPANEGRFARAPCATDSLGLPTPEMRPARSTSARQILYHEPIRHSSNPNVRRMPRRAFDSFYRHVPLGLQLTEQQSTFVVHGPPFG